jgi:hypothetical protein
MRVLLPNCRNGLCYYGCKEWGTELEQARDFGNMVDATNSRNARPDGSVA